MNYDSTHDDRLWSMLSYVLSFPTSFVAPLVIFLVKKDTSRFVAFHALQCLLMHALLAALCFAAGAITVIPLLGWLFAMLLGMAAGLAGIGVLVFGIVAAIKSFSGEWYEIPLIGKIARQQVGV